MSNDEADYTVIPTSGAPRSDARKRHEEEVERIFNWLIENDYAVKFPTREQFKAANPE